MSYVQKILQPGETVRHKGSLHWIIYFPAILFSVIAVGAGTWAGMGNANEAPGALIVCALSAVVALAQFVRAWFEKWTTEMAVTDKRIIYKIGFISRRTSEMNMARVESVDVNQSVLGRILDYGDVNITGTGSSLEPLRKIASPLQFRSAITAA